MTLSLIAMAAPAYATTISSFTPTSGVHGTTVTISGSGFTGTTGVTFNGFSASSLAVNSDAQITATVPYGATTGPIVVESLFGVGTSSTNFVISPPQITSIAPLKTVGGSYFEIRGNAFTDALSVSFNGISWSFMASDTLIQTQVPPFATSGTVSVTTYGGTATSAMSYTIIPGLIPNNTFDDDVVGWGQIGNAAVEWNPADSEGSPSSGVLALTNLETTLNGTQVQAISICVPVTAGTTYSYGSMVFMGTSEPAGTAFINAKMFSTTDCSGTSLGQMGISPPPRGSWGLESGSVDFGTAFGAQSVYLQLGLSKIDRTTTNHAFFDNVYFDVTRAPSISSFSPTSGPVGTIVTVLGADFYGNFSQVQFTGASAANATVTSSGRAQIAVPAGAVSGPIKYSNGHGTATSSSSFTVIQPPTITGLSPSSGIVGSSVRIDGANLGNVTAVRFNGVSAPFVIVFSFPPAPAYISASVPVGATTGPVTVTNPAGTAASASPFVVVWKSDFNGDGKPDIVLRNYVTGQNALWLMNGTALSSVVDLPALSNVNYRIEGTADFNNNGQTDIVLRNYSTGQNALWLMNGTTISSIVDLPALANTEYHIEGTGDFNGDGKPDIILRNYVTGQNAVWLMNGTSLSSIVDLPALANTSYRIDAIGDFNGDGKPDIVLRNYTTGQNAVWIMNGTALSSIVDLPALPNTAYEINGPR